MRKWGLFLGWGWRGLKDSRSGLVRSEIRIALKERESKALKEKFL